MSGSMRRSETSRRCPRPYSRGLVAARSVACQPDSPGTGRPPGARQEAGGANAAVPPCRGTLGGRWRRYRVMGSWCGRNSAELSVHQSVSHGPDDDFLPASPYIDPGHAAQLARHRQVEATQEGWKHAGCCDHWVQDSPPSGWITTDCGWNAICPSIRGGRLSLGRSKSSDRLDENTSPALIQFLEFSPICWKTSRAYHPHRL